MSEADKHGRGHRGGGNSGSGGRSNVGRRIEHVMPSGPTPQVNTEYRSGQLASTTASLQSDEPGVFRPNQGMSQQPNWTAPQLQMEAQRIIGYDIYGGPIFAAPQLRAGELRGYGFGNADYENIEYGPSGSGQSASGNLHAYDRPLFHQGQEPNYNVPPTSLAQPQVHPYSGHGVQTERTSQQGADAAVQCDGSYRAHSNKDALYSLSGQIFEEPQQVDDYQQSDFSAITYGSGHVPRQPQYGESGYDTASPRYRQAKRSVERSESGQGPLRGSFGCLKCGTRFTEVKHLTRHIKTQGLCDRVLARKRSSSETTKAPQSLPEPPRERNASTGKEPEIKESRYKKANAIAEAALAKKEAARQSALDARTREDAVKHGAKQAAIAAKVIDRMTRSTPTAKSWREKRKREKEAKSNAGVSNSRQMGMMSGGNTGGNALREDAQGTGQTQASSSQQGFVSQLPSYQGPSSFTAPSSFVSAGSMSVPPPSMHASTQSQSFFAPISQTPVPSNPTRYSSHATAGPARPTPTQGSQALPAAGGSTRNSQLQGARQTTAASSRDTHRQGSVKDLVGMAGGKGGDGKPK